MLKNIVGLNINMIIRCASSSQQQPISLQTILTILRRLKTRMGRTNKQNDDSRLAGFVVRDVIVPVIATNSSLSSWLDIWPCPHVLVFLLDPAQLGIAILLWYLILQLFIVYWSAHYSDICTTKATQQIFGQFSELLCQNIWCLTCFMMSNGKGQICSKVWMAILSSRPLSLLSLSRS